ncbi:hypothetical protein NEDG_00869 [Nematocida displodere]|uniref:Anaphase-promoting complex subunit 6 n=1 Tax=Nematocida displodere TaxID=1805483 RepID=A0A177EDD3_9MICR|nr:hypothetical protein NEDG_00869 [Nematocida displodere]
MEVELYRAYQNANFEESTLVLLEHMYRTTPSPETLYLLLESLLRNSNYEAIRWLVSRRKEYFAFAKIKKIYVEAMRRMGALSEIEQGLVIQGATLSEARRKEYRPINAESVATYYQALILKGREKKKKRLIRQAVKLDERNLEAMIYMGMCYSAKELVTCIEEMKDTSLQNLYHTMLLRDAGIFSVFSKEFLSPFSCCRLAKSLFNGKRTNELFHLAQYTGTLYPKHYFTYVVAGMYYILTKHYTDAKRSLFQSIQVNNTFGLTWVLLGYCQSALCECINAINCYEKAELLMEDGCLASLGIALEYHRMRSYEKAEKKYTEIAEKYSLQRCFTPYVSLLTSLGRYKDAIALIKDRECSGETALLKSFCYLFALSPERAEVSLEGIDATISRDTRCKYYLLKGYVFHMNNKYCQAIEAYQKAILDPYKPSESLINDLLELAIKNSLEHDTKKLVCQYGEDVFDFLDLKSELAVHL